MTRKKTVSTEKKTKIIIKKVSDLILPKEVKDKILPFEEKLDKYMHQVIEKFDKYVIGMSLLPPPKEMPKDLKPEEIKKIQDRINILILIDDSEPSEITKIELHNKILQAVDKMAVDIDPVIYPEPMLISSLWQNCYDKKYDVVQLVASGQVFFDKGTLAAIRISELHKQMVLQKFEKYIVSYVLGGSIVQGTATEESDIDVFVIIDDTDVKKMTRIELKDKLRSIIVGLGFDAGDRTGIRNKLNIQVYVLTDFWESVKEAHPVIFTLLRDGIPFFDRGVFMPWKQLLKTGRIKPSPEAIDAYMKSGTQNVERARRTIKEIAIEDFFWATITPSQAALMMIGIPPPTPKEAPGVMQEEFVKKRKLLSTDDVALLKYIITTRKDLEHNFKKEVKGAELDVLMDKAELFLKKLKTLFEKIETMRNKDSITDTYDQLVTVMRDILIAQGADKVKEDELVSVFNEEIISRGKLPAKYLRVINDIFAAKDKHEKGKIKTSDISKVRKFSGDLLRSCIELLQRTRGKSLERATIKVKHGKKFGEVILLDSTAFIQYDLDDKEQKLQKATVGKDGSFTKIEEATLEEFEKAIASVSSPSRAFVKETIFESLKKIFGKHVEVLIGF